MTVLDNGSAELDTLSDEAKRIVEICIGMGGALHQVPVARQNGMANMALALGYQMGLREMRQRGLDADAEIFKIAWTKRCASRRTP